MRLTKNDLYEKIREVLDESIAARRESILASRDPLWGPYVKQRDRFLEIAHGATTDLEIEEFLLECPFSLESVREFLLSDSPPDESVELSEEEFEEFLNDVQGWESTNNWIAGDGSFLLGPPHFVTHETSDRFSQENLLSMSERSELVLFSPSLQLLKHLFERKICFNDLSWREFEELVAELLKRDDYEVVLGKGTKDGGVDIRASKHLPGIGHIQTIWQAKHLPTGNKVGLSTIRELADTTTEQKASKGIIVTSSLLTRGAIDRITRDCYKLGKIDRDDLNAWIQRILG